MRLFSLVFLLVAAPVAAQHHEHHQNTGEEVSPYADEAERAIKALSAQETEGFLAGQGMGLARAAELNGYPGPKHVLELADSLALTPEQREEAERLMAEVQDEAQALGAQIVEIERHLDALFSESQATPEEVDRMTSHLGGLRGRLRAVHLKAHIAMREALTPEQVVTYNRLRGYAN